MPYTVHFEIASEHFVVRMAWRYLGQSNAELVSLLKRTQNDSTVFHVRIGTAVIRNDEVRNAMLAIDRGLFVPDGKISLLH